MVTKDPYDKPFYHKFASILGSTDTQEGVDPWNRMVQHCSSSPSSSWELMPQNFFPSLDKPYFRADVFYPDGYSIHEVGNRNEKGGSASDAAAGSETGIRHIRQHTVALLSGLHFRRPQT